jgi:hypothetical protein
LRGQANGWHGPMWTGGMWQGVRMEKTFGVGVGRSWVTPAARMHGSKTSGSTLDAPNAIWRVPCRMKGVVW